MPYCDANSACDSPSFERSTRTSTGSRTLTIRTGKEISPRANETASFSPETMSRATRERRARSVGAFEVFDDLADFFFVGIRQVLLFILCICSDEHHRVRLDPKVIDQSDTAALSHPRPGPPGLANALCSGHHVVSFRVGGDSVFHLCTLFWREQSRDPPFIGPRRDHSRTEHVSTIRDSRTACQDCGGVVRGVTGCLAKAVEFGKHSRLSLRQFGAFDQEFIARRLFSLREMIPASFQRSGGMMP